MDLKPQPIGKYVNWCGGTQSGLSLLSGLSFSNVSKGTSLTKYARIYWCWCGSVNRKMKITEVFEVDCYFPIVVTVNFFFFLKYCLNLASAHVSQNQNWIKSNNPTHLRFSLAVLRMKKPKTPVKIHKSFRSNSSKKLFLKQSCTSYPKNSQDY